MSVVSCPVRSYFHFFASFHGCGEDDDSGDKDDDDEDDDNEHDESACT